MLRDLSNPGFMLSSREKE